MGSIFTKIIDGEIPAYKIAETDNFLAFLDVSPLQKGHTLVIPKVEVDYIFDVEDDILSEMIVFSKIVSKIIKANFKCNRVGMAVIGLEVPHAHIHLIPISKMSDMNFANEKLKLSSTEMEEIHKKMVSK
jgi:histidine triad (HIT) family protein